MSLINKEYVEKEIKIEPNTNFYVIDERGIPDSDDAKFKKYRYEWMNNPT